MSLVVEFELTARDLPLTDIAGVVPDLTLCVEDILASERSHPVLVFRATGERFDALETALETDRTVATHSVLGRVEHENRRLYRVELTEQAPQIYTEFIRLDVAPIDATIAPSGWRARTRFSNRETLARFYTACSEYDITFQLDSIYEAQMNTDGEYGLTAKQRETLLLAHREGYFEIPRQTSLETIGSRLGVSAPSVSERLRRAHHHLIESTLLNAGRLP